MIFVTVGTHEQGFDRLIKKVDQLVEEGKIKEEVYMQIGYSNYIPKNCNYDIALAYEDMKAYTEAARINITHGGPGSIFLPIRYGKKPIVVPRNPSFNEHVDNHQIEFSKRLRDKGTIECVLDIEELLSVIQDYKGYNSDDYKDPKDIFVSRMEKLIQKLFN